MTEHLRAPKAIPSLAERTPSVRRGGEADGIAADSSGRVLGGSYLVLEQLGRGGMGVVYRVRDLRSNKELALKQLLVASDAALAVTMAALFEREFYALAQLAHPRVIEVYDFTIDPAGPFYTMELLDGGDLQGSAPLEPRRACALMLDVCSSLALLHARRLVHRDISPRNVRCTRDGRAKLIDFGAMVPMGPCQHAVGTPAYVAPEVVQRAGLDARCDLFSLGATLYYALTGSPPFSARNFSQLQTAWSEPVVLPSQLVPGIAPELDALCVALLQIDPALRPRSAFEVVQRLAAIAGVEPDHDDAVLRAYLETPELVARDHQLRHFRRRMRAALHGAGGTLCFEGAPGHGRSRLLDTCVLEAKTLGSSVLRAATHAGAVAPFAIAQQLASQLLLALPEAAVAAAEREGVHELLFESGTLAAGSPRLRMFGDPALDGSQLQAALAAWFARVAQAHPLLIAVDDAERGDELSAALLAELSLRAEDLRLLLCLTCEPPNQNRPADAFAILLQHAAREPVAALSRGEVQTLLGSIFGQVPQLALLSERLFGIALGSPRETLALAEYLVDSGAIRYGRGQWTLPSDLDSGQLPASAQQAFAARVRALPELARQLAQAHALVGGVMRREDYAVLAPNATAHARDAAVAALLAQAVLQSDGAVYSLANGAVADALVAELDAAEKRARHLALYELQRRQPDPHPYLLAQHLLEAGQPEPALDLLATQSSSDAQHRAVGSRASPRQLAATFERALEIALALKRPARELYELRRRLCELAMLSSDNALFIRVGPAFRAQLELDCGLSDYRALDVALPASVRLQQALTVVVARHSAAPESERVYRADEAIKHLATYAAYSLAVAYRMRDPAHLPMPEWIEPFVALSTSLFALWQNTQAAREMFNGQPITALGRWHEVYERLANAGDADPHDAKKLRTAVVRPIALAEAIGGRETAFEWADKLELDPQLQLDALRTRRIASLVRGDLDAAEHYGRTAEALALRTNAAAMFAAPWALELEASAYLRDLAGLRRVIDGVAPLAARYPGWRAELLTAEGYLELLRGAFSGARAKLTEAVEFAGWSAGQGVCRPELWTFASAGLVYCLSELCEHARAIEVGERALVLSEAHRVELYWHPISQALALAEARAGKLQPAAARLEALIEAQRSLGVQGARIALSYVSRIRVAIWARDAAAAARYTALALAEPSGDKILAATARHEPLLADARNAGIDLAIAPSEFEASVFGSRTKVVARDVATAPHERLTACADAASRAACVLDVVCELADAASGQLYLVDAGGVLRHVAARNSAAPDAEALRFARGFFEHEIDDAAFTAGVTQLTRTLATPGAAIYFDGRGGEHRVFLLTCKAGGALAYLGVVVTSDARRTREDVRLTIELPRLAAGLLTAGDTQGTRASS